MRSLRRLLFTLRHRGRRHCIEIRNVRPFASASDRITIITCACSARIIA